MVGLTRAFMKRTGNRARASTLGLMAESIPGNGKTASNMVQEVSLTLQVIDNRVSGVRDCECGGRRTSPVHRPVRNPVHEPVRGLWWRREICNTITTLPPDKREKVEAPAEHGIPFGGRSHTGFSWF
mmetsp:Transcript_18022/g.35343  ORF Transcript_18022/g.35343 Transcript_18022/m.35343 type:complete len:127 (-) Transcript_18022:324-704(-)